MQQAIRAIPNRVCGILPPFEHYYPVGGMKGEQVKALRAELVEQGFLVQDIWLNDPTEVLMHAELRAKLKEDSK